MKLKALALALLVSGFCASFALADDGGRAGTGSTATASTSSGEQNGRKAKGHDGSACRPMVAVELKGSLVSVGAASFVMDVKRANRHGRDLAGKQATIGVDDRTRIKRRGNATLADLKPGDRLSVQARACKAAPAASAPAAAAPAQLVARKVDAHPAKAAKAAEAKAKGDDAKDEDAKDDDDDDKDDDHASTSTTTATR
jgi:hypothetical protein